MRLTARFLIAFVVALALALGVTTWRNLERERALFDADLRHDARRVGQLVAQVYEHAAARGGPAAAAAALAAAQVAHADFTVTRVATTAVPPAIATELAAGRTAAVRNERARPDGRLDMFVPLEPGAVLRVSSSLAAERRYLAQTKTRMIWLALAALTLAAVATSALGVVLIARPTRELVAKARRVGAGDFAAPLRLRHRDELGELAIEINLMTEHLAAARVRIEAESTARVAAVEQLRHADRLVTVGKLAAGIAHELGTPLNVIEGRARMIETGDAVGDEIGDSARIVVEQARRITRIIRQLLDFARRGGSDKVATELAPLARQAVELMAASARTAGVTLVAPAPCDVRARVDAAQLQQVLTNLIGNAVHATPAGGAITVTVRADARARPSHGDAAPQPTAVIEVADTGVGMDPAVRERIFEPFFTTKPVGAGTGLGLAVVHGIVADHGGWVDVSSTPGHGSRFAVHLPVS
ncbi:MAG: HAMP domain-containing histidine kinase [Myxococcales bacterium]|nr:HAMP domain-containing histidine kinase [Myxococcales bacterium]